MIRSKSAAMIGAYRMRETVSAMLGNKKMRERCKEKQYGEKYGGLEEPFLASSADVESFRSASKSRAETRRAALEQDAAGEQCGYYDKYNIQPQHRCTHIRYGRLSGRST